MPVWVLQALVVDISGDTDHHPVVQKLTGTYPCCVMYSVNMGRKNELHHDKTNKLNECQSKTQINLSIHPDLPKSSLYAYGVAKDPSFLHADSDDSDQTGRLPRLMCVFAGSTGHFVGFVMLRLKFEEPCSLPVTVHHSSVSIEIGTVGIWKYQIGIIFYISP